MKHKEALMMSSRQGKAETEGAFGKTIKKAGGRKFSSLEWNYLDKSIEMIYEAKICREHCGSGGSRSVPSCRWG